MMNSSCRILCCGGNRRDHNSGEDSLEGSHCSSPQECTELDTLSSMAVWGHMELCYDIVLCVCSFQHY